MVSRTFLREEGEFKAEISPPPVNQLSEIYGDLDVSKYY
jgi:hypothetical protein